MTFTPGLEPVWAAPTTMTLLETRGVACRPISPGDQVDLLVIFQLEIDHTALAEAGIENAGGDIERLQAIARASHK